MLRQVLIATLVACHAAPPNQVTVPVATTRSSATAPAQVPMPLVINETFGDFGCRGWSPQRRIALCFVGATAAGQEPEVTGTFFALDDDAQLPADVPIGFADTSPNLKTAKIPTEALGALREATRGFVSSWTEVASFDGMDGSTHTGNTEVFARSTQLYAGGENAAPSYRVSLFARSNKQVTIDDVVGAISGYGVAVYRAGRTVLIERTYSIADEGQYEHHVDAFVFFENR